MEIKAAWIEYIHALQDQICKALEQADGIALFAEDAWERAEGGGGKTRTIANGAVIEKGGVNTSVVFGTVSDAMRVQLKLEGDQWFAGGLSLVIHPRNPYAPTVHANWRYFELYDAAGNRTHQWFGGGCDLTPYYIFETDVQHFHQSLKDAIDPFGQALYAEYKKNCDQYFSNTHRNHETRGVGGVFYDHLRPTPDMDEAQLFAFQQANGNAFVNAYLPILQKRKDLPYGPREIAWQEIRRGRYVEFNLIHDRGTLFGLKTNGRTESILMSLPPRARWEYNHQPAAGSEEEKLLLVCQQPVEWI